MKIKEIPRGYKSWKEVYNSCKIAGIDMNDIDKKIAIPSMINPFKYGPNGDFNQCDITIGEINTNYLNELIG